MLDTVLDAVTQTLISGGVSALREFPHNEVLPASGAFLCVGYKECKYQSAGFGDFLGIRTDVLSGAVTELFGKRLEITLELEVFSPYASEFGAEACVECADKATEIMGDLPPGLRVIEIIRGEVTADEELSLFRCVCSLRCMAYFLAEKSEEKTEYLDFILKGAVSSANQ